MVTFKNDVLMTGYLVNGLYKVKGAEKAFFMNGSPNKCVHDWHRCLGHRDLKVVKQMSRYGLQFRECNCSDVCEVCLRGKMSRVPFPKESTHASKEILELVHSDVCGPFQVTTPSGNRYFVTFIETKVRCQRSIKGVC